MHLHVFTIFEAIKCFDNRKNHLKTYIEKEKILVNGIFSFFHDVFHPFQAIVCKMEKPEIPDLVKCLCSPIK